MDYTLPDGPKMLRETLCLAQSAIIQLDLVDELKERHIMVLQRMINECDRHRPLGINGKHANLHTATCGCEDKGDPTTWGTIRSLTLDEIVALRKANVSEFRREFYYGTMETDT